MSLVPELLTLLGIAIVGPAVFARFEIETPAWRKVLKWTAVCGLTLALARFVGHWAIALPLLLGAAGTTAHFVWCRRNGIDPFTAAPLRRYDALRGWTWRE